MTPSELRHTLNQFPAKRYLLGFSGGCDSHVLLDLLVNLRDSDELTAAIGAIHINHQLHPSADQWVQHCQRICNAYHVELLVETVKNKPSVGDSVEAFARQQRYTLIEKHLSDGDVFLSAHHQRDQAETFLLQLMRGAGLSGLRAMPVMKTFGAGQYVRPLLHVAYDEITQYATSRQLAFIHDDSNDNTRFERNYLRHEVLPLLEKRFPQAQAQIARSAAWLQEVSEVPAPSALSVSALQLLPRPEKKQQLRAFVKAKTGVTLSRTQTDYVLNHHLTAAADKQPTLVIDDNRLVVRRFNDEILLTRCLSHISPKPLLTATITVNQSLKLAELGELVWQSGQGLDVNLKASLAIRPLHGSQRFHPHSRARASTVKKLLHEANIPPWLRPFYWGLYHGDALVAMPNIGVAQSYYHEGADAYLPLWKIAAKFVRL